MGTGFTPMMPPTIIQDEGTYTGVVDYFGTMCDEWTVGSGSDAYMFYFNEDTGDFAGAYFEAITQGYEILTMTPQKEPLDPSNFDYPSICYPPPSPRAKRFAFP